MQSTSVSHPQFARDIVGRMSITLILAILALVVALINAVNGKAPLWIAVALLALAMILPGFVK
jgi:hypothetical protein